MNELTRKFMDALSIQETGWDNSKVVGANNVYNIKDFSGTGTQGFDRREGSNDKYRNFNSREEADQYLYDMLGRRYPGALEATTIEGFTDALRRGGYATDPNHGRGIQAIYRRKYGDGAQPVNQPAQPQSIDFTRYEAKYGDKIRNAKNEGYDDATIMRTIQEDEATERTQAINRAKIDAATPRAEREVSARLARSGNLIDGVAYLATLPGFREEINYARSLGKSDEEILRTLVPNSFRGLDAYKKRRGTSVVKDVGDGIVDQLESYGLGARQLLEFDPARERQLLEAEAMRRLDPERVALQGTIGGQIGAMVPDIAAGIATGSGGLAATAGRRIAVAGASGAIAGALNPIVDGESRSANAMIGGALSAGAGAGIEGLIASSNKVSDKVRQALQRRDVPYDEDVRARVASQRMAHGQGVQLTDGVPYIDEAWMRRTGQKLSSEFDDILDNNGFVMPKEFSDQLLDPNFRKNFSAGDLADIDKLLFEEKMMPKMVLRQKIDASGNVVMEPRQQIMRDATGAPIKEDYQVSRRMEVPQTEVAYRPSYEYRQNPPSMKRVQKIGDDGHVETEIRRKPILDVEGDQKEQILYNKYSNRFSIEPMYETYQVPKYHYKEFPGESVKRQVRDEAGNVVMEPRRVKMRDEQGNVIMQQVDKVLNKSRTKMLTKMAPSTDYIQINVPQQVVRTTPVSLREAHDLLKAVKSKYHQINSADYVDPFQRDAFEKLSNLVEDGFHAGAVVNPEWLATKQVGPMQPDYLRNKLSDLNQRYAKYAVAKDVFAKAAADGSSLGDVKIWESVLKNKRYSGRMIRGEAPLNDVLKGLQENQRELERMANLEKNIKNIGGIASTLGFATGNPIFGSFGAAVNLGGKAFVNLTGNPVKGLDKVLSSTRSRPDELLNIQRAAAKNIANERRVQNLGGDRRREDRNRVLKKALERRPVPIITNDEEQK